MRRRGVRDAPTAMERPAKRIFRSAGEPDGEWNPGCRPVSVCHLPDNYDAPWVGIPPWYGFLVKRTVRSGRSGVPAGAGVSTTPKPQLWWERSAAKRPVKSPDGRSDQLQPSDGCPTGEGPTSNPDRRTGPVTKDLNTPSLRPALLAESNLKSAAAAFPRGRPRGERIIPRVEPGQQGPCPQVSMAGNTGKARQRNHYHRPETRVVSLVRVNPRIVQSSS